VVDWLYPRLFEVQVVTAEFLFVAELRVDLRASYFQLQGGGFSPVEHQSLHDNLRVEFHDVGLQTVGLQPGVGHKEVEFQAVEFCFGKLQAVAPYYRKPQAVEFWIAWLQVVFQTVESSCGSLLILVELRIVWL